MAKGFEEKWKMLSVTLCSAYRNRTTYLRRKNLALCVLGGWVRECFMNGTGFHVLFDGFRQSMVAQLKCELNIDKILKDVTSHFGLKWFHLIFKTVTVNVEITATIMESSCARHYAWHIIVMKYYFLSSLWKSLIVSLLTDEKTEP